MTEITTKVEMFRCSECGHTLTRDEFELICFADSYGKDHYIGLMEDGECPECGGVLEDILGVK